MLSLIIKLDFLDVMMFISGRIYFMKISLKKFPRYSSIRFASWKTNNKYEEFLHEKKKKETIRRSFRLHEVGLFTAVKDGNYQTGQVRHLDDGWIVVKYTLVFQ